MTATETSREYDLRIRAERAEHEVTTLALALNAILRHLEHGDVEVAYHFAEAALEILPDTVMDHLRKDVAMAELLKEMEWSAASGPMQSQETCPSCHGTMPLEDDNTEHPSIGHQLGCKLAAALGVPTKEKNWFK